MFVGPIFAREAVLSTRRPRTYLARSVYVAALLVVVSTAWLVLTGTQLVRDVGDMARFGMILFQTLALLQSVLAMFFSALLAASAVSHEKDRGTIVLLLLTRLNRSELVLGRLLASLLQMVALLAASLPVLMLIALMGGVAPQQIFRVLAVTLLTIFVSGSLGSTLALWREKTFQALAATVLVLVFWGSGGEVVAGGLLGDSWLGISTQAWAEALSPWRAVLAAARPVVPVAGGVAWMDPTHIYLAVSLVASVLLNGIAILGVRRWNTASETPASDGAAAFRDATADAATAALPRRPARTRRVWDNPVLWREVRTRAYGRRLILVRLAYLVLFALAAVHLWSLLESQPVIGHTAVAAAVVPLCLLSLLLVNAQAVTALTGERDARALDLLLVSDLTPPEIVFGKLGGAIYNAKEMIVLPLALCVLLWIRGAVGLENLAYVLAALVVLLGFAAVLGLHFGISYANSRTAVAASLGTLFFLFVGVALCMRMLVAFSGSFQAQLQPFLAFMIGGGAALYLALGARNPSTAIGVASFLCPFATFYAITSYLLGHNLAVFLVTVAAYGFAAAAMLIPAVVEFDVATGRTTAGEE